MKRIENWQGLRVWVVGASSGIGNACARTLARRGAIVAASARSADQLDKLVEFMPGEGHLAVPFDVTDAAAFEAAAGEVRDALGGIDLVLLVAGLYTPMRATDIDLEATRRMLDVNLLGAYHGLAAVTPILRRQGHGHIAFVASVAGYRGLPQALVYGPTKAALINLAEVAAIDLGPHGIDVHVVNPGFVETPATAQNEFEMPALMSPESAAEAMLRGLERGRFEIHFPKRFTRVLKLLKLLPDGLYFRLIHRTTGL